MPVVRHPRPSPQEIPGAEAFLPETRTLRALRSAVATCHGCPLYKHATQAVFGEGLATSKIMMIGEVPGDSEDLAGKPFVGPAGRGHALTTPLATYTFATVHPASVLRAPDEELRHEAKEAFLADMHLVGEYYRRL